jgi:hypothetical protein
MNPRPTRAVIELLEAKALLSRARVVSGVSFKQIGNALGAAENLVANLMHPSQLRDNMRLGDLLKLSKDPDMRAFVTEVLAAVQANYEQQTLRVCDLEAMSHGTATADVARMALKSVAARLWPQIGPITTEPRAQETANGNATNDSPVRTPGEGRANGANRRRRKVAPG